MIGGFTMSGYVYFTDEQKQRANSVDLVDFLQRQGEKILPSGRDKRLASDHSITIRGSQWYDHAAEEGSHAIDLVKRLYHLSFPEAVSLLLGGEQGVEYKQYSKNSEPEQKKSFNLPEANTDMRRVFAYLIKQRFIDRNVLTEFAKVKLLYEDKDYHNAVFVGVDENDVPRHAHKKSTLTVGYGFRGNVEGSNPAYSFHYISKNPNPHTLFVYEAPIDMLSYISMYQKNWQNASYAALNGVSEQSILRLLDLYSQLDHVVLCLDHDVAGIEANERIYDVLMERAYYSVGQAVSKYKDWNEDLKVMNGAVPIPAEEHPQLMLRDEVCGQVSQRVHEFTIADSSIKVISSLYEQCKVHLHWGRFEQTKECLRDMTSLSVLAAAKEYKQMEYCRDLSAVESRLRYGFKAYKNRGKLKNKLSDIRTCLVSLSSSPKVELQSEKLSRAEKYERLAAECLKGVILADLQQPVQIQTTEEKQSSGLTLS
jgi:hypothetical protein